jgi:hypothetical protein
MRGIRIPVSTPVMPASARTSSMRAGNLPRLGSGSVLAARIAQVHHQVLITWVTQFALGFTVVPSTRMRLVVCSITARIYDPAPARRATTAITGALGGDGADLSPEPYWAGLSASRNPSILVRVLRVPTWSAEL